MINHPVVREYLTAENAFCRIVQQINWQLIENLDFEADFEGKQTEGFTDGGDYERQ